MSEIVEVKYVLSDDEATILEIAAHGESMMPIGRWERPVETLVKRGFLRRFDRYNNAITTEGRTALTKNAEKEDQKWAVLAENLVKSSQVNNEIRAKVELAAQSLVDAARLTKSLKGDSVDYAYRRWLRVMLERTLEIMQDDLPASRGSEFK